MSIGWGHALACALRLGKGVPPGSWRAHLPGAFEQLEPTQSTERCQSLPELTVPGQGGWRDRCLVASHTGSPLPISPLLSVLPAGFLILPSPNPVFLFFSLALSFSKSSGFLSAYSLWAATFPDPLSFPHFLPLSLDFIFISFDFPSSTKGLDCADM